ncbi:LamG domain-containing protein [Planctomicrobium sp. SH527]|uniref:LamG domain-containing protein n=1 Tax=Planctomicrobium sp. SH527 TaxID=3448123 RepID=UPI003F5C5965
MKCFFFSTLVATIAVSTSVGFAGDNEALSKALTLHASFDTGMNADYSRGDKTCYVSERGKQVQAEANSDVTIAKDAGRFGDALHFTKKSGYRPEFRGTDVLNYNDKNWSTTVSTWLCVNPDKELEPGYCDPVQIVGNDSKKGFIFLEWSKDETPRFFRYAIRPLFEIWNPENVGWEQIPAAKRPMIQVADAPFDSNKWTHVVFTVENGNDKTKPQQGKLYIDGKLIGTIQNWDLTFGWNPEKVLLVLGAAYVGKIDDLAVFDRALTDDEVKQLHQLKTGVRELYK